ncbi:hypothetical protein EVAR_7784_1 [Eumeta japonica]|uniref:Uncharacterized protein n=1 Tax=Eumeta variegata TaxID=151549 RepID=A0A4C1TIY8_EUMVA|nr:hypothetical protein EVAR_7784_1 [Eumeta japonica]
MGRLKALRRRRPRSTSGKVLRGKDDKREITFVSRYPDERLSRSDKTNSKSIIQFQRRRGPAGHIDFPHRSHTAGGRGRRAGAGDDDSDRDRHCSLKLYKGEETKIETKHGARLRRKLTSVYEPNYCWTINMSDRPRRPYPAIGRKYTPAGERLRNSSPGAECRRYPSHVLELQKATHAGCVWESLMKNVTLGNVTMSRRERGPPNALRLSLNYDRSAARLALESSA